MLACPPDADGSPAAGDRLARLEPIWASHVLAALRVRDIEQLAVSNHAVYGLSVSRRRRLVVPVVHFNLASWDPRLVVRVDPLEIVDFRLSVAADTENSGKVYEGWGGDVNFCLGWLMSATASPECKLRRLRVRAQLDTANGAVDETRWEGLLEEPVVRAMFHCLACCQHLETLEFREVNGCLWWMDEKLCSFVGGRLLQMKTLRRLRLIIGVVSEQGFLSLCEGIAGCSSLQELTLAGCSELEVWMEQQSVSAVQRLLSALPLRTLSLYRLPHLGNYLSSFRWPRSLLELRLASVGITDEALQEVALAVRHGAPFTSLYLKFAPPQAEEDWHGDRVTDRGIAAFFRTLSDGEHGLQHLDVPCLCDPECGPFGADLVLMTLQKFMQRVPSSFKSLAFVSPSKEQGSRWVWDELRRVMADRGIALRTSRAASASRVGA